MTVRDAMYRLYWKLEPVIAPGLKYSQTHYEATLAQTVKPDCTWLDLGCGHQVLPSWRLAEEQKLVDVPRFLVGVDYDMPSLKQHTTARTRVRGDIQYLPFASGSFDVVTANMVFEHLQHPQAQLQEIRRILRPGGVLVFHTPNARGYLTVLTRMVPEAIKKRLILFLEGRVEEDVFPTHYTINSEEDITALAGETQLDVEEIRFIPSTAEFIMIPPLVIVELLWIRLTMTSWLRGLRTNLIVRLHKPYDSGMNPSTGDVP